MAPDIYAKLARHLDDLPGGFPPTPTGVELRILKRLFTEEEARLALCTGLIPEQAEVVAKRAGLIPDQARERLEEMAVKGLIFSIVREGRPTLYMAAQYVIGIWEYHLNDLDEGLIRDMNEYIPHLFTPETWTKGPQLRTIPVERSLEPGQAVMPHEQARELVKDQRKFLVAPCICRREHEMIGEGCDKDPRNRAWCSGGGPTTTSATVWVGRSTWPRPWTSWSWPRRRAWSSSPATPRRSSTSAPAAAAAARS